MLQFYAMQFRLFIFIKILLFVPRLWVQSFMFRSRVKTTAYYKECPSLANGTAATTCSKTLMENDTIIIRSCGFIVQTNETSPFASLGLDLSCGCAPEPIGCNETLCNCFTDGCNGSESRQSSLTFFSWIAILFIGLWSVLFEN